MNEICAVFPGEGSQYFGMAKAIYDKYEEARELFGEADTILNFSLEDVIFNRDVKQMDKQEVLQPAILVASCAYFKVFQKRMDVNPTCFTGYGVGSISALFCAGAISFQDAVQLAHNRGKVFDASFENKEYLVVQIEWQNQRDITQWVDEMHSSLGMVTVAYISAKCCVVCMPLANKRTIIKECKKNEISVTFLPNNVPVGSEIAEKCTALFEKCCSEIHVKKLFKKVYSFMDGSTYNGSLFRGKKVLLQNLSKELCKPLNVQKMVETIVADGVTKFVNVGPSKLCSEWIKELKMPTVRVANVDWEENPFFCVDFFDEKKIFNKVFLMAKMLTTALSIQNSCFDDEMYEKGVLQPYASMKKHYEQCVSENREPKDVEIKQQKEALIKIMKTKGLNSEEIENHLQEIENETLISFI